MPPVTLEATKRKSSAIAVPKDFSAPMASTGIVDLAALRQQSLIVDSVLSEGTELFEGIVHRVRPGIEFGIVLPSLLVDPFWIGRKFIPEPVQIDPLTSLYQPFNVGTAEIEMPQCGTSNDIVPITDSRQRRVDRHPARDPRRVLCRQRVSHHIADVVGDEIGFLNFEGIHYAGDVDGLILFGIPSIRMGRQPHAAQVGHDHGVILYQYGGERRPHVARIAKAMQQHDRRPLSADSYVETGAVGLHHLRVKARGEGLDACQGGRR